MGDFMYFLTRLFGRKNAPPPTESTPLVKLACRADLWCRKRTSISTMLDPDLFALYMTGDDRLDEDWVIQSNPPCAFKVDAVKEGCDALFDMLQMDAGLHATKGWLTFSPPAGLNVEDLRRTQAMLAIIVKTAERELKSGI